VQIVSLLVLIWSIANVFIPLEMALNRAWGVKQSRSFWRSQGWPVMSSVSGLLVFSFIAGAASRRMACSGDPGELTLTSRNSPSTSSFG
jgi:membrane protein/epoxyqueuosine reductase